MCVEVILKDLPKLSLNQIYAGKHWTKRNKDKNTYKSIIQSQFNSVFSANQVYSVAYEFHFKNKPFDTSNTVYMLKMIEDVIFKEDTYKIIPELIIKSKKAKEDFVLIKVTTLQKA